MEAEPDEKNRHMTETELRQELKTRERLVQTFHGQEGIVADQWRGYKEAMECLEASHTPLRLWLQTSAGTGKSFLLETLLLWATLNGHNVKATAPTGIATARLRMPQTPGDSVALLQNATHWATIPRQRNSLVF